MKRSNYGNRRRRTRNWGGAGRDSISYTISNGRESVRRRRRRNRYIKLYTRLALLMIITVLLIAGIIFGIKHLFFGNDNSKKTKSSNASTAGELIKEDIGDDADEIIEEETGPKVIYPKKADDYEGITDPEVKTPFIAVVDTEEGKLIAGRNADARIFPASMTKVMTLIVAVEHIQDMTQTFTMTNEIIDPLYLDQASRAGFEAGEAVTAKDLMYGLILPSGADGAVGLAMMVSGTEEEFVKLMNEKCVEMGLKNTHFTNTSGLHSDDHYTTPIEQAMIMDYAMQNETCAEILSTYQYTTAPTEKHPEGILLTSTMFSRMYGDEVPGAKILAGKTGYTQEAKQCLVSCAESKDKKYVVVTAGGDGRWDCIYDDFNLYGKYCEGAVEAANSPAGTEAENDGNTEGTSGSTGIENTSAVGN